MGLGSRGRELTTAARNGTLNTTIGKDRKHFATLTGTWWIVSVRAVLSTSSGCFTRTTTLILTKNGTLRPRTIRGLTTLIGSASVFMGSNTRTNRTQIFRHL